MTDAALLGVPREFQFKGKVYKLCFRDLLCEIAFADWVMAEAALALARLKPRVPAEFYAEQMKIYNSKLSGKGFSWGSEDVHNAIWSSDGQRQLLYLKMKRGEEHGGAFVEREMLDEIAKDAEKYAELQRVMLEQDFGFFDKDSPKKAATETAPSQPANPSPPEAASTPKT